MKSITIHGVDEHLADRLKRAAEEEGTSMNRTVKRLLQEALGLKPRPHGQHRDQFEAFHGVWSRADVEHFGQATADFESIDENDWQ